MQRADDPQSKFLKSGRNRLTETAATEVILRNKRFQRIDLQTKRRLIELLDVKGRWTHQTFDLVMTPLEVDDPITITTIEKHLRDITLVEVKATRKPIPDASLSGFFFGATETEYLLAAALGDRFRYAFVVHNDKNVYGKPFFVLLTHADVERKTRSRRIQFQVNFKTGMPLDGSEDVYLSVPYLIAAEAERKTAAQAPTPL